MANYYIIFNENAIWGVGETRSEAIKQANKWICQQPDNTPITEDDIAEAGTAGARDGNPFVIGIASDALAHKVERCGGDIGWEEVDGVHVTCEEAAELESEEDLSE